MDITTILGVILGLGGILLGATLEGLPLSTIIQPTAAMIVFGGTFGATLLQFPLGNGDPFGQFIWIPPYCS